MRLTLGRRLRGVRWRSVGPSQFACPPVVRLIERVYRYDTGQVADDEENTTTANWVSEHFGTGLTIDALRCVAVGDPLPTFRWSLKGVVASRDPAGNGSMTSWRREVVVGEPDHLRSEGQAESILALSELDLDDTTPLVFDVTCRAVNSAGHDETTFRLYRTPVQLLPDVVVNQVSYLFLFFYVFELILILFSK